MTRHVIEDTRMRRASDEHWTLCLCGVRLEAASNLDLVDAWNQHRRANGERVRSVSDTIGKRLGNWSIKATWAR